jgi:hypothetical protein
MKTSELTGAALDWAVAKCEGYQLGLVPEGSYTPSTDWAQGGPIIEREISKLFKNVGGTYTAQIKIRVPYYSPTYDADIGTNQIISVSGKTLLIASMRCYVASKLGEDVSLPDELT